VVACFLVSACAGIALAVVYALGGQPQWEGALLGTALLGMGVGLVAWSHRFLSGGPFVEHREDFGSTPAEQAEDRALEEDLARGGTITRRKLILGSLGGAVGALFIAFLFPARSLGPNPGNALYVTPWRPGRRAVTDDGRPVRADDVPRDGLVTVFPEGFAGSADGQTVLVRVDPDRLALPRGRRHWAAGGLVAYSKVCTHAGCPVGLYEPKQATLLCPCHQSSFAVLTGGDPLIGPAARPLPQLPIAVDEEGYVIATSDFREPIGPTFWFRRDR
jgi:ubiquinol-cytochrome c reductase iron-sulfur subunit